MYGLGAAESHAKHFQVLNASTLAENDLKMSYYENLIPAVSSKFSVFGCCLAKEEHINMSNEEQLLILSEKYTKWLGKFRK